MKTIGEQNRLRDWTCDLLNVQVWSVLKVSLPGAGAPPILAAVRQSGLSHWFPWQGHTLHLLMVGTVFTIGVMKSCIGALKYIEGTEVIPTLPVDLCVDSVGVPG